MFLLKDTICQLFWWKVFKVLFRVRVLDVEVSRNEGAFGVVLEDILYAYFPGGPVPFSLIPPFQARGELLEPQGLGLGVRLPCLRQRLLIVPDVLGRTGANRRTIGLSQFRCKEQTHRSEGGQPCVG